MHHFKMKNPLIVATLIYVAHFAPNQADFVRSLSSDLTSSMFRNALNDKTDGNAVFSPASITTGKLTL